MSAKIRQILFVPPAPVVWANHLDAFARQGVEVASPDEARQMLGMPKLKDRVASKAA